MMGGHHADAVYWWDDGEGFTTSAYAGPADASGDRAGRARSTTRCSTRWRAAPPQLWPADAAGRLPGAGAAASLRHARPLRRACRPPTALTVETRDFLDRTDFQDQLRASPRFDPLTLRFRRKAGRPATGSAAARRPICSRSACRRPIMSAIATAMAAPRCASSSHALDQALGTFLAKLDALGVPYVVVLTADHGAIDAAERASERGAAAQRIDGAALVKALNEHLMTDAWASATSRSSATIRSSSTSMSADDPALRDKVRDEARRLAEDAHGGRRGLHRRRDRRGGAAAGQAGRSAEPRRALPRKL